jgi:putative hemin transport protein
MKTEAPSLKDRWSQLLQEKPKTRIRDAAKELGVSEAELLATGCGGAVTRLEGDWTQLIREFPRLGRVMCLTRNEAAVHERYGDFQKIDFFHGMGQVVGPDIDLRLFMSEWKYGFAVTDKTPDGDRQSFQFFDAHGAAVHKIFLQKESNYGGYGVLLDQFRSPNQSSELAVEPPSAPRPLLSDAEIDVAGFRQAWKELKDTHAFFMLLGKFRVGREQALRLAPEGYAKKLSLKSTKLMLEKAAADKLPIMVFIGSPGCIQIHTGPVANIRMFGEEWLNILDDEFNMHLFEPLVASAWMVRKPTTDGDVTSIELYDAKGENITLFFGKRKPGEQELPAWRKLVASLPAASWSAA